MPTVASRCTAGSTVLVRCSDCMGRSRRPEIDDTTDDFTVEQVRVGVVDVVKPVSSGDHLVEQQLTGLIEPGQPGDIRLRIARPEYGAGQRLVHQDEILQVD